MDSSQPEIWLTILQNWEVFHHCCCKYTLDITLPKVYIESKELDLEWDWSGVFVYRARDWSNCLHTLQECTFLYTNWYTYAGFNVYPFIMLHICVSCNTYYQHKCSWYLLTFRHDQVTSGRMVMIERWQQTA